MRKKRDETKSWIECADGIDTFEICVCARVAAAIKAGQTGCVRSEGNASLVADIHAKMVDHMRH